MNTRLHLFPDPPRDWRARFQPYFDLRARERDALLGLFLILLAGLAR